MQQKRWLGNVLICGYCDAISIFKSFPWIQVKWFAPWRHEEPGASASCMYIWQKNAMTFFTQIFRGFQWIFNKKIARRHDENPWASASCMYTWQKNAMTKFNSFQWIFVLNDSNASQTWNLILNSWKAVPRKGGKTGQN